MQVAVVLRLAPELSGELEIADDGKEIDREWVGMRLNEFDDHALEEAILLKEADGANVIALALAGEGVDRMLQSVMAQGADRCNENAQPHLKAHCRPALQLPSIAAAIRGLSVLNSC